MRQTAGVFEMEQCVRTGAGLAWRRASPPAVEGGILPPGKNVQTFPNRNIFPGVSCIFTFYPPGGTPAATSVAEVRKAGVGGVKLQYQELTYFRTGAGLA